MPPFLCNRHMVMPHRRQLLETLDNWLTVKCKRAMDKTNCQLKVRAEFLWTFGVEQLCVNRMASSGFAPETRNETWRKRNNKILPMGGEDWHLKKQCVRDGRKKNELHLTKWSDPQTSLGALAFLPCTRGWLCWCSMLGWETILRWCLFFTIVSGPRSVAATMNHQGVTHALVPNGGFSSYHQGTVSDQGLQAGRYHNGDSQRSAWKD